MILPSFKFAPAGDKHLFAVAPKAYGPHLAVEVLEELARSTIVMAALSPPRSLAAWWCEAVLAAVASCCGGRWW